MKVVAIAKIEPLLVQKLTADARFDFDVRIGGAIDDAAVLITRTINRVDRALMKSAPRLRLIAQGTAGTDNIDLAVAAELGIAVVNLPGINANAVAELVIGHMIALTRTVPAYSRQVATGIWNRDDCAERHELRHYGLGIIGHGNVGSRVSRYAAAFGMKPRAYDPYISDFGAATKIDSFDELLATSDIVTLHVPLTEETRRMVGAKEIARMRRGSFLLNAARGEVLDLEAALAALENGHLAGLAIDVFDEEPPSRTFPDDPRLIVTPHIAGCTYQAKNDAAEKLYVRIVEWAEREAAQR